MEENLNYYMVNGDGETICGYCKEEGAIDGYMDESICCPFYCETDGCKSVVLCFNTNCIDNPCAYKLSQNKLEEYYKAFPIKLTHIIPNKILKQKGVVLEKDSNLEKEMERLKGLSKDVIEKYKLDEPIYDFRDELYKIYKEYENDEEADGLIGVCDNCKRVKYAVLRPGD